MFVVTLEENISKIIGEKEKPYEKFYFKANPFPVQQILYPDRFIGFKRFNEMLLSLIKKYKESGNSNSLVIYGDNKGGKSHALRYIEYVINTFIFLRSKLLRAVYIHNPPDVKGGEKGTFHDTYRGILEELSMVFFDELIKEISKNPEIEIKKDKVGEVPNIKHFLMDRGVTKDLSTCFDVWYSEDKRDLAWNWLCGHKLNKFELEKLGVMRNIESSSRAIYMLNEIIKCGQLVFNKNFGICILIDEFEELERQTKRDRIRYYADIRNLIDSLPRGLLLIIGTAPSGWNKLEDYVALLIRLKKRVLYLKELDEKDALEYARNYLRWGREEYCKIKNKTLEEIINEIKKLNGDPEFFPFTRREIIEIFNQSRKAGEDVSKPGIFLEILHEELERKL